MERLPPSLDDERSALETDEPAPNEKTRAYDPEEIAQLKDLLNTT